MLRRASIVLLLFVALSFGACVHRPPMPTDIAQTGQQVVVETASGPVAGVKTEGNLSIFLGVPYAKAPVGELRFMPPHVPDPWKEVRPATKFGPVCPQEETELDPSTFYPQSEDCLNLNVWTPATDGARRPVLMFIHGGGFFMGASSRPLYDGAEFAKRGDIVVVTINYRVGALGFMFVDQFIEGPKGGGGNMGLLDQVAALEWIKRNIEKFGGDPGNVTIMGESAGSMSVTTLMTMPSAMNLFGKAIAESGAPSICRTEDQAIAGTRRMLEFLNIKDPTDLRTAPVDAILKAQSRLMNESGVAAERSFMPVIDGRVIPKSPMAAFAAGEEASIPLLNGTNKDEFRFWLFIMPLLQYASPDTMLDKAPDLKAKLGDAKERILAHYKHAHGLRSGDLSMALATDIIFWVPHLVMTEEHSRRAPTYMYQFDWPTPVSGGKYGAHHGLELPFVFHNINVENPQKSLGPNPPLRLSDIMNTAWISFIRTGVPKAEGLPAWPTYSEKTRATMIFDEQSKVVNDPKRSERVMYKGVLY